MSLNAIRQQRVKYLLSDFRICDNFFMDIVYSQKLLGYMLCWVYWESPCLYLDMSIRLCVYFFLLLF